MTEKVHTLHSAAEGMREHNQALTQRHDKLEHQAAQSEAKRRREQEDADARTRGLTKQVACLESEHAFLKGQMAQAEQVKQQFAVQRVEGERMRQELEQDLADAQVTPHHHGTIAAPPLHHPCPLGSLESSP